MHSIGLLILLILSLQPHAELQAVLDDWFTERSRCYRYLKGGFAEFSASAKTLVVKLLGRKRVLGAEAAFWGG
jgi:hypothetical protein